ncbi:Leucine aminopeptidase 1 [Savitreella phatthalungensis]
MRSLLLAAGAVAGFLHNVALDGDVDQQLAQLQQLEELANEDLRLISLGDGPRQQKWMLESDKDALRRAGIRFMDVTDHRDLGALNAERLVTVQSTGKKHKKGKKGKKGKKHEDKKHEPKPFPKELSKNVPFVKSLIGNITQDNMRANLEILSGFHNRYWKSSYGAASSTFLYHLVQNVTSAGTHVHKNLTVRQFEHPWGQHSIIARIPGYVDPETVVVVGAHQDSANLFLPTIMPAPGADDDGSGTVTTLEVLRVLLSAGESWKPRNTVEFHWYSAEEGGLLGSQAVFADYERRGIDVAAMLQQDMTGYVPQQRLPPSTESTTKHHNHESITGRKTFLKRDAVAPTADTPESLGVIVDFVDEKLTDFIKLVVSTYCAIPFVETKCGYACSDHASASRAGYRSAFVIESSFENSNHFIHSNQDTIDKLSFPHMAEHAKLTLGYAVELGSF